MKTVARLFHSSSHHININHAGEFPTAENTNDRLIEATSKTCHPAYGGKWNISVYEKSSGERYNKTEVSCMKCNMMRGSLYSPHKSPHKKDSPRYRNSLESSRSRKKNRQRGTPPKSSSPKKPNSDEMPKRKLSSRAQKSLRGREEKRTPASTPAMNLSKLRRTEYLKCGMYYGIGASPVKDPSPENKQRTYKSPTYSSDSSNDSSPTRTSSQISFKTEKKRRSNTNLYKAF